MTTTYAGIDYGLGRTNIDKETGIRFGVICQNDLMHEALDDVFQNGRDLGFENFQAEFKSRLRHAMDDYFSDYKRGESQSKLDQAVEAAFDAVEDDLNDGYQGESGPYRLEQDGYLIQTDASNDLWVFKSPYFTHAQFCSPCAPGAGHLGNPCADGPRTYCFGHEWFDGGKAPYPVYSVKTGELVASEA